MKHRAESARSGRIRGNGWRVAAALTLALSLSLPGLSSPAAAATTTTIVDGVQYAFDTDAPAEGATAMTSTVNRSSVVIPDTIDFLGTTYDVVAIAPSAFKSRSVTSVVIGDNVITIGESAFDENSVSSLDLGSSVVSIGSQAFYVAPITTLTIPDSVETIGASAFEGSPLTSLTLGSSLETIGDSAFGRAHAGPGTLSSVVIPDSVTSIGAGAFSGQPLTSLTLGSSVESIGTGAFADGDLTEVSFPDSVRVIGVSAFTFNQLRDVTFGAGALSIGDHAFYGNEFTSLTIPASVTDIGRGSFGFGTYPNSLETVRILGVGPTLAEGRINPDAPYDVFYGSFGHGEVRIIPECAFADQFGLEWNGYPVETPSVSFELGGHGAAIAAQPVVCGATATAPAAPTAADWTFDGWRLGSPTGVRFSFATPVTADLVLYAAWTAGGGSPATPTVSVATDRQVYNPGQQITVSGASGLPAGTRVEIVLRSDPVVLGTATVDAAGAYTLTASVPTSAALGDHSVVASATVGGALVTASAAIRVEAVAGQPDGDTDDDAGDEDAADGTGSDGPAENSAGVLPSAGAPPGLQGLALLGLASLAAGVILVRRRPA